MFFKRCLGTSIKTEFAIKRFIYNGSHENILLNPQMTFMESHNALFNKAQKSILVQINPSSRYDETMQNSITEYFSSRFGKIKETLPIKDKCCYLIEFQSIQSVKSFSSQMDSDNIINRVIKLKPNTAVSEKVKSKTKKSENYMENKKSELFLNALRCQNTVLDQMKFIASEYEITPTEIYSRYFVFSLVGEILNKSDLPKLFKFKEFPFGSSLSGLGRKESDLDIAIVMQDQQSKVIDKDRLSLICDIIHKHMPASEDYLYIPQARVPLLSFKFKPLNLPVDVVLQHSNSDSVNMLATTNWYCKYDVRFRLLALTIRKWAHHHNLLHHGDFNDKLTPFLFQCLILFYLMRTHPKVLPGIEDIPRHSFKLPFYKTLKLKQPSENKEPIENLLMQFFEYYSKFDFRRHSICLRKGTVKHNATPNNLLIGNPFLRRHNMSVNCSPENFVEFQNLANEAKKLLEKNIQVGTNKEDWGLCSLFAQSQSNKLNYANNKIAT